jgi:hypothetical protein
MMPIAHNEQQYQLSMSDKNTTTTTTLGEAMMNRVVIHDSVTKDFQV